MGFSWRTIAETPSGEDISTENFWSGIKVWADRPHLVNPKLLATELNKIWTNAGKNIELIDFLITGEFCTNSVDKMLEIFKCSSNDKEETEKYVLETNQETEIDKNANILIMRNLVPKQINVFQEVLEAIFLDHSEKSATFFPKKVDVLKSPITPPFPYKFKLVERKLLLEVLYHSSEEKSRRISESEKWLKTKVFTKVSKWCQNIPKTPIIPSIRLVSARDYNSNLYYLKNKYAKKFVEIWPNYNNTNPNKYVYEDISIAAYLITIWAEERKSRNLEQKQTFVDLGCGNGFLDHILSSEGHKGIGIDLRRRKIWDVYEPATKLIEMVIEPNDKQLYPAYDWIIGNHSDELTPWIPVIAARSSYNMRMFLLPCCFYSFNGKYARADQDLTQYQSYLNFMQKLCMAMGFDVELDRLRIPSTKRTCLICTSRNYMVEQEAEVDARRNEFINSHLKKTVQSSTSGDIHVSSIDTNHTQTSISNYCASEDIHVTTNWISDFTPRGSVEYARNCTSINKKIIDDAIMAVTKTLLSTDNYVSLKRNSETFLWNKGGTLKMADLCNLLDAELLKKMKNQRGGFQTLLRNHRNIFEIKDDFFALRMPSLSISSNFEEHKKQYSQRRRKKTELLKPKICFFHFFHPQGCPLSNNDCTFSHEDCVE